MSTKNIVLGGVGMVVLSALAYTATSVSAYRGNTDQKGPNYTEERHAQMEQAFESKDYAAWKNLMAGKGRITEVVNEGNFSRFAQMHELKEDGKYAEADAIRQELGLGNGNGNGKGHGMKNKQHKQGGQSSFVDANNNGVCDKSE